MELTFSNLVSDKKSLKQLTTINKMVDNCLDLQSEAKDYENINLETHKKCAKFEVENERLSLFRFITLKEKKSV